MKLRSRIEELFASNTDYANPSQATNQASSLGALSKDLYTDSKRFIYELLQNADDSSQSGNTVKVTIKLFGSQLVVGHTGKPFDARDLLGLCNVNNGTKKGDTSKTGYKGIGFKSVFGQSEKVTIYTNEEYFRFDAFYQHKWAWEETKHQWEEKNDREFIYPWQIIPIYTDETEVSDCIRKFVDEGSFSVATIIELNNIGDTCVAIQELSNDANMFMFLKNIGEINFVLENTSTIKIIRSKSDRITLEKDKCVVSEWVTRTISLSVPPDIKEAILEDMNIPDKLRSAKSIDLTMAAKMMDGSLVNLTPTERLLYAYLPTEETKYSLPILVNTSFLTNANRENLHIDSKWNQWIFKNIAIEIFNWIAMLVDTDIQFDAYKLIPNKLQGNDLEIAFNEGMNIALEKIPFLIEKTGKLVKIKEAIIDFTFLSSEPCIGEEAISEYINSQYTQDSRINKFFIQNTGFGRDFKRLGASTFEWNNLKSFLSSEFFVRNHTLEKNILLIKHLKIISDNESIAAVNLDSLGEIPFLWDHKGNIVSPRNIYFPTADDDNWNNPESELSFLHADIQRWLSPNTKLRHWLESVGVVEKTDVSYIRKTIIPNVETYIDQGNAIKAIQDIFSVYRKGHLPEDLLSELKSINLLTTTRSLKPAKDCILSKSYSPRIELEDHLLDESFVSKEYLTNIQDKDEWKRFFKLIGVSEGVETALIDQKTNRDSLIKDGFIEKYFSEDDKKFSPYVSTFVADSYINILSLNHLKYTVDNQALSKIFWQDVISNISLGDLTKEATAFWGREGRAGRLTGNAVQNYIPWFVKNVSCIPTLDEECHVSGEIFLNTKEMQELSGSYLPVFDGVELSADWRAFFDFKTKLELSDYLKILEGISSDLNTDSFVKKSNITRIQSIYKELLDRCANWSEKDISDVSTWAKSGLLLNTKDRFNESSNLKFFIDGNETVFQDQYFFIQINAENRKHPEIRRLLEAFTVDILEQSDFELVFESRSKCNELSKKIDFLIPYFKALIRNQNVDKKTEEKLASLDKKVRSLEIYSAENLQIRYEGIEFTKNVHVHIDDNILYVTSPWDSNRVHLRLPELLCNHFELVGHDRILDFLLRSSFQEIESHFDEESLDFRSIYSELESDNKELENATSKRNIDSFRELEEIVESGAIGSEFYHISKSDYQRLKYAEGLVERAVRNVVKFLGDLHEYDCSNFYQVAPSVIGGITKNGNDITIVARPSDNNEVLLYYSSEYDVLEYVDAEFWCEDGVNPPHKITLGMLLRLTEINKIPIKRIDYSNTQIDQLLSLPRSESLEYTATPFAPIKLAQIVASFANTSGGILVFGIADNSALPNRFVEISGDFQVSDIVNRGIAMLSPTPKVTYDWVTKGADNVFIIEIDKSEKDILLEGRKYIRENDRTINQQEENNSTSVILRKAKFERTIAVIVCVENYAPNNGISKVKYASNDAHKVKETLVKYMDVDEENIHMYIDKDALRSSLQYELRGLFNELSESDRLIFYYVGHGFHNGVTNYISTYDTHKSNIADTSLSLRNIVLDPFSKSKCKTALFFIDACATTFEDENERMVISNLDVEDLRVFSSDQTYCAIFLSCEAGQSSYSCDDLENGVWTHYMTNALSGNARATVSNKYYVTDRSLNDYLASNVAQYIKSKLGYNQNPRAILDSSGEYVISEITTIKQHKK